MTILIFPSNTEESLSLLVEAKRWAPRIIGASSLEDDPNAIQFDTWERLPYIGEEGFFEVLEELAKREQVTEIVTPNAPSYLFLKQHLPSHLPEVKLRGENPYKRITHSVEQSIFRAHKLSERIWFDIGESRPINLFLVTALLSQANHIFGECSDEKAYAMCIALASASIGDVIEIGSFFGKSAYILNRQAAFYGIGTTISIDAWKMEDAIQYDSPHILQELTRELDWERVFQGFLLTMMACSIPPFNYIHARSEHAWEIYNRGEPIISKEFGVTPIAGRISVLHIDGNHDETDVRRDFTLWSQRLVPDAWIIFDDYEWSLGDGPRKVADQVIERYGDRVCERFVAGGALFIKLK